MAEKTVSIKSNSDQTITIKSGRYRESISLANKTSWQQFDAVKWAIITAGFDFSLQIEELVRKELNL